MDFDSCDIDYTSIKLQTLNKDIVASISTVTSTSIMNESLESPNVDGNCPKLLQHFKLTYPVNQWKTEGFFDDQHLLDINCHWMTFEPTRSFVHFLSIIIYVIVFLIGFLSNSFTIYIVTRFEV